MHNRLLTVVELVIFDKVMSWGVPMFNNLDKYWEALNCEKYFMAGSVLYPPYPIRLITYLIIMQLTNICKYPAVDQEMQLPSTA